MNGEMKAISGSPLQRTRQILPRQTPSLQHAAAVSYANPHQVLADNQCPAKTTNPPQLRHRSIAGHDMAENQRFDTLFQEGDDTTSHQKITLNNPNLSTRTA
jgi:hypothetical protein